VVNLLAIAVIQLPTAAHDGGWNAPQPFETSAALSDEKVVELAQECVPVGTKIPLSLDGICNTRAWFYAAGSTKTSSIEDTPQTSNI
jgi:hypothetical protein